VGDEVGGEVRGEVGGGVGGGVGAEVGPLVNPTALDLGEHLQTPPSTMSSAESIPLSEWSTRWQ